MDTSEHLKHNIQSNIKKIWQLEIAHEKIQLDNPPEEKLGDYAFACFELAKELKLSPAEVAKKLRDDFSDDPLIERVSNFGPYLNIFLNNAGFVEQAIKEIDNAKNYGQQNFGQGKKIVIEFSGPNTNKPQHIGHARNDLLGQSLVNLYKNCGFDTVAVNIVNDRGIHIVKSMLAWMEFANGETPESSGMKGDSFVGKYYVKFSEKLSEERKKYFNSKKIDVEQLSNQERKNAEQDFLKSSELMKRAQEMLVKWENNDTATRKLWKMMNDWVYKGFEKTYADLGIHFDKVYYESDTYRQGKEIVQEGLEKNVFFKKEDGSIWIDLTNDKLDEKLVLRADGTSVYITQDLALAARRYDEFHFDQMTYVVGSEQIYHFKVLFLILKKLGYDWADNLFHLSYGMVNLPEGKMKSREGTVVDADDLIQEVQNKAEDLLNSAEKQIDPSLKKDDIKKIVGMGALKFFMLGTNPQKDILFNPKESVSFDGYTGPFIQYTHARINNILKKAGQLLSVDKIDFNVDVNDEEKKLSKMLLEYPEIVKRSTVEYNPALLCQYLFEVSKTYNHFYQMHSVLNADNENKKNIRLYLCLHTKYVIKHGLDLLGIEAPEVM